MTHPASMTIAIPTPVSIGTRDALHRVAVHVVARSRVEASGRFSLRVTPGGIGTTDLGERRVRIASSSLLVESDEPGAPTATGRTIDGATLRELAAIAGVDLARPLDVGHDTPPLGDADASIVVDAVVADELGRWYGLAASVLDRIVVEITTAGGTATLPRVWPEHFDAAVETDAAPARRVNLGASPGDAFCQRPYWYVGPWSQDRPGDAPYWNAPFGAYLPATSLGPDEVGAGLAFLRDGLRRLRSVGRVAPPSVGAPGRSDAR